MTEERKQELKQLLSEALMNLEIRYLRGNCLLSVNQCKNLLQQSQKSWDDCTFTTNEEAKLKLLDFIRKEFAPFVYEDRIQPVSYFIRGGATAGESLDQLLDQLLKITVARGVKMAVSKVDRCTQGTQTAFQFMTLLEGIQIEKKHRFLKAYNLSLFLSHHQSSQTIYPI